MGLPRIGAYDLPLEQDLPEPRVPWRIDAARAALLIHDMQSYFVGAFTPDAAPIAPVVANIDALRRRCDASGIPVFYSAQPGDQDPRDRGLQRDFWGLGMSWAEEHQAITPALAPGEGHTVLTKWRYSAFQRTNLEPMLHARGRDQLIVTGIYAHIGCLLTTAEGFMRDFEMFFVADAVADFSREKHDLAVTYAAERCARVTTMARLLDGL